MKRLCILCMDINTKVCTSLDCRVRLLTEPLFTENITHMHYSLYVHKIVYKFILVHTTHCPLTDLLTAYGTCTNTCQKVDGDIFLYIVLSHN